MLQAIRSLLGVRLGGEGQTIVSWFYSARWSCHGDCFQLSQDGCSSLAAAVTITDIHNVGQTDNTDSAFLNMV